MPYLIAVIVFAIFMALLGSLFGYIMKCHYLKGYNAILIKQIEEYENLFELALKEDETAINDLKPCEHRLRDETEGSDMQ